MILHVERYITYIVRPKIYVSKVVNIINQTGEAV